MRTHHPPISSSSLTLADFTGVVDRHQNALCAFLHHLVGDIEQAYDLLQDTFHDAWRAAREGLPPFVADSDEDQMRRWLFRVAYYKGIAALRRRRLIRWESLDFLISFGGEPDAASAPFEDQLAESEALRAALARLAPQDRACFLLRAAHGLSAAEVGQIVGASPEVVRKRLSRARQRLRAIYLAQNTRVLEPGQ
ncbi:MAG TPA: sigma-70 family RNA polymerase sigma factor [Ktedonobacterales bacterium]|nr:sigma-70 family RNA polymerase sigma factor [Ktedonobacterales bacterium]